jgi:rhamnosyltransferase
VSEPAISIVIPTYNGMGTLPALLDAIASQEVNAAVEVVAVDSASRDGTRDLLRQRVDKLIEIPPDEFDHGLTRNLGVQHARGALVVLMVQDALPASKTWLASLIAPLAEDPTVAGSFARQQPRVDASAITRYYAERATAAGPTPRVVSTDRATFDTLHPMAKLDLCTFDNVCSCIRRSVWARLPFKSTPIGEDIEWARDVLLAGHRLAYVPDALVIHSHDRSARYELARTYVLHHQLFALLGVRTIPLLSGLARAVAWSIGTHLRCQRADPHTGGTLAGRYRAISLAFAWPLGQYLGALYAARGWKLRRWARV